MLAVTLDDYSVHVLDIDSRKVVRKLPGHHSSVNDMVRKGWAEIYPGAPFTNKEWL